MPTYLITPVQTKRTSHLSWQDVTNTNQVVGTAINVAGKVAIRFFCKLGRRSGTAFSAATAGLPTYPQIRFEASTNDSGDGENDWFQLFTYSMQTGASIANTTLNGGVSAAATSIVVNSATNIAAGDFLFLKGDTDGENELVRVKSVSGTTINLDTATPVVYAKASGNAVTDQAEVYNASFGCSTIRRIRAVIDNGNSGQTVAAEVSYTTHDGDSATGS
jgi:hypothetical protein